MYKGCTVVFLAHCPTYGGNYGCIKEIDNNTAKVQLCNPQSSIVTIDVKYITMIEKEKIPKELLMYLPYTKMSDLELRDRLDLIDQKLNAIGIRLGL